MRVAFTCRTRGYSLIVEKTNNLAECSTEDNLLLHVNKTKELNVDLRKEEAKTHTLVCISGAELEHFRIP